MNERDTRQLTDLGSIPSGSTKVCSLVVQQGDTEKESIDSSEGSIPFRTTDLSATSPLVLDSALGLSSWNWSVSY